VRVEGDKILADVDWTPSAAKAIREGEYKYVSPEFVALKRDDAGVITQQPKLIAAGLTNRPFLKTLGQITLSDKTLRDLAANRTRSV
jgi:phage I-like protein